MDEKPLDGRRPADGQAGGGHGHDAHEDPALREYLRAANEDDDGYDPYSDRPASPEPLFERDPWA